MGRVLSLVAALAAAVTFCVPASAKTDGPAQLAFVWPVSGTVTGWFGELRGSHVHPGLDIGILRSPTVRAASMGFVMQVGTPRGYEGYGNVVIVRSAGFDMLYAHLESASVRRGEWVSADQPIGVAGCSGWCTGTHLHFEIRDRGRLLDPLDFLG